ncbi:NAD(P)/FAD-dependent oxidoreductase [Streptomyces sp. NPDC052042]|uniref:NAD(P)/FAD-dependent oxidoreductase n=1 Tax=Streptomyces sp. NPDC052042 TaxID=3365683 RepID=UPI0037CFF9E0
MTGTALWALRPWTPRADDPPQCSDTLVVGGGLTGLIAALELQSRGASVTVLEAGQAGAGASGRAFGSLALGCTASPGALTKRYGPEQAVRIWRESSNAVHVCLQYLSEWGVRADLHRAGHVRVAVRRGQEDEIRAQFEQWRRLLPHEELSLATGDELAAEFPGAGFRLGLVDRASASLDPYRLLGELVTRFQDRGGRFVEHTPVTRITRAGDRFTVLHRRGRTAADKVLVATDGHTGDLLPWLGRRVYPVGSYMIATAPLPPGLRDAFSRRTVTTADVRKNYFRVTGEGRLVFGGRLDLAVDVPPARIEARLRRAMLSRFPALRDIGVTHAWGGRLGFTFDQVPHVGTRDGVHYAVGYCGRGLPMSVVLGRLMAHRALDEKTASAFGDGPFPARWYFRSTPWFVPLVAGAHRVRDLAHRRRGWERA